MPHSAYASTGALSAGDAGRVHQLAAEALAGFAASGPVNGPGEMDAGPAVLASLAAEACPETADVAAAALARWLEGLGAPLEAIGLWGGLAGYVAGTQAARRWYPRIENLAGQLLAALALPDGAAPWRTQPLAWHDYDLPTGPAGVILAAATADGAPAPPPAVRQLVALCSSDDLRGLRIGTNPDHELIGWNFGRINTGLAHGAGAVAAALRAAAERAGRSPEGEEVRRALRRVCDWLVAESFDDPRGLRTWQPAGRDGADPPSTPHSRQGWCYGTPGLAWTLWDCGRVLGDAELQRFAAGAMRSFCAAFDPDFYIDREGADDALGICHGAAGMLAIADAFALHAGHPEAAALRGRLLSYLLDRVEEVGEVARVNMTLQTGAAGILAVLLTMDGGRRDWLSQVALR